MYQAHNQGSTMHYLSVLDKCTRIVFDKLEIIR